MVTTTGTTATISIAVTMQNVGPQLAILAIALVVAVCQLNEYTSTGAWHEWLIWFRPIRVGRLRSCVPSHRTIRPLTALSQQTFGVVPLFSVFCFGPVQRLNLPLAATLLPSALPTHRRDAFWHLYEISLGSYHHSLPSERDPC